MIMCKLLNNDRKVTAKWHINQAEELLKFAIKKNSASSLIYAALEARIGLERFVFEMSVLAKGGNFEDRELEKARKRNGIFDLLKNAMDNYRKHLEFCNVILDLLGNKQPIPIPNIQQIKRLITRLSDYCHPLFTPINTVEHEQNQWFVGGVTTVNEAISELKYLVNSPRAAIERSGMYDEVGLLFDEYLAGKIKIDSVRTRLYLMQPILEARMRV